MEDFFYMTLLFDFYGELLTDKQKQVLELFYLNDLSLTEIGAELNISRQAVKDFLNRSEKILLSYENRLNLAKKFTEQKDSIKRVLHIINQLENDLDVNEEMENSFMEIKNIVNEIMD